MSGPKGGGGGRQYRGTADHLLFGGGGHGSGALVLRLVAHPSSCTCSDAIRPDIGLQGAGLADNRSRWGHLQHLQQQ